jgi:ABC-type nickel/cobalt efflux system permease component RcnA
MTTPTTFSGLVNELLGLINQIIPVIFAVVFVFLVWKIFDAWVINAADEKKREEGKQYAIVASVIMVIMVTIWGIVEMLRNTLFGF